MPIGLTDGDSFRLLSRALDLRQASHERVAGNLAHQDTPGYKARHLEFQDALKAAVGLASTLQPVGTHPGHMGVGSTSIDQVSGKEKVVRQGGGRDGNTVSPEDEMARMAENALMYNTATQIIGAKFRGLRNVIREGR
ncbi:MAG: flagellar basal body rod protein FlgB [Leptospirillia bacterium]